MPAFWTTKTQRDWLCARIPQYLEAQRMSRIPRILKTVHQEWSDTWPERDVVCPPKADEPNLPLTPEQEAEVAKITARRYGQILSWFQRNTGSGRRRSRTTLNLGGNTTKHKNNRVNHASEIYYEKFRERVRPTYLEQVAGKGPLNKGQRLSLLKKISKELFDQESEEIRLEVMAEQIKQREEKEAALENDEDKDDNEQERPEEVQRFIKELPDLMRTALGDVSKKAGGWCFLVLAGGPLPKDGGNVNLFEIWVGPTSKAGYGFPDAHAPYVNEVRQPFSNFVTKILSTPLAQSPALVTSTIPPTTPGNPQVHTPSKSQSQPLVSSASTGVPATITPVSTTLGGSKTPPTPTNIDLDAPDLIKLPRSSSLSPGTDKNKNGDKEDEEDEDIGGDEEEHMSGHFDQNFERAFGGGCSSTADGDDRVPPHLPMPAPTTSTLPTPTPTTTTTTTTAPTTSALPTKLTINTHALTSGPVPTPITPSNSAILSVLHQPVDADIPPTEASKHPFAPGGPSSPIENAFRRMNAQVAQQQATVPFPLDPRLAAMSSSSENVPTTAQPTAPSSHHPNATQSSTELAEKREIATAKRLRTRAENKVIKAAITTASTPAIPTAAPTSALPPSAPAISGNNTIAPGPMSALNPPPPTPSPPSPNPSASQPSSDTIQRPATSPSPVNSQAKGKRPSKKAKVDKVARAGGSSESNNAALPEVRPRHARHPPPRPDDAISFAQRGPPP